jgi:hypothetical protein
MACYCRSFSQLFTNKQSINGTIYHWTSYTFRLALCSMCHSVYVFSLVRLGRDAQYLAEAATNVLERHLFPATLVALRC